MTGVPGEHVAAKKPESRIVFFRVDEDELARLDPSARQTSCSRGEVLRRCLRGARLFASLFVLVPLDPLVDAGNRTTHQCEPEDREESRA